MGRPGQRIRLRRCLEDVAEQVNKVDAAMKLQLEEFLVEKVDKRLKKQQKHLDAAAERLEKQVTMQMEKFEVVLKQHFEEPDRRVVKISLPSHPS